MSIDEFAALAKHLEGGVMRVQPSEPAHRLTQSPTPGSSPGDMARVVV